MNRPSDARNKVKWSLIVRSLKKGALYTSIAPHKKITQLRKYVKNNLTPLFRICSAYIQM